MRLIVALVVFLPLLLPISVDPASLQEQSLCGENGYHFIITQFAPEVITVQWGNKEQGWHDVRKVSLIYYDGWVAHYHTWANRGAEVTEATAWINARSFDGVFVLDCNWNPVAELEPIWLPIVWR